MSIKISPVPFVQLLAVDRVRRHASLVAARLCRAPVQSRPPAPAPAPRSPRRRTSRNITQLTFGGENAEAYFSFDGKRLSFQSTAGPRLRPDLHDERSTAPTSKLVSNGQGRTTCAHYTPDGQVDRLRVDASGRRRVPAGAQAWRRATSGRSTTATTSSGSERRRHGSHPAHEHAGLRRRGDDRQGRPHRVHERARRRHGDLLDERRRLRRPAPDESARSGRRAVLLAGRLEDRVPRPASRSRAPSSTTTSRC